MVLGLRQNSDLMNEVRQSPLTKEDIEPYREQETAVRLGIKNELFAGIFSALTFEDTCSFLHINPFVPIAVRDIRIEEPEHLLFPPNTYARGTVVKNGQPFRIVDPTCLEWKGMPRDVLVIKYLK